MHLQCVLQCFEGLQAQGKGNIVSTLPPISCIAVHLPFVLQHCSGPSHLRRDTFEEILVVGVTGILPENDRQIQTLHPPKFTRSCPSVSFPRKIPLEQKSVNTQLLMLGN